MPPSPRPPEQLTRHFHVREFHCRDGTPVPVAAYAGLARLARVVLEPARSRFGACYVTSGYRTREYNRRVGGAPSSHHIYDLHPHSPAADLRFSRGTPREWHRFLDGLVTGGLGLYPSFVHVDLRGYRSRW